MNAIRVWRLDPLPDFLLDHTLTGEGAAAKLQEIASRWIQLLGGLWVWEGRGGFGLRFVGNQGRIEVWLVARAAQAEWMVPMAEHIGVLLRSHNICDGLPLGDREQREAGSSWTTPAPAIVEVRQYQTRDLWRLSAAMRNNQGLRSRLPAVAGADWEAPPVIYAWWAPGGPYLVPFESLLAQGVMCSLTVHLEPTRLTKDEWTWLGILARESQSLGEQTTQQISGEATRRMVDPAATLAGRLYMANLRRLSDKPFMVAVQCAAAGNRFDVANNLAAVVQSLAYEPPFDQPQQDESRLPSASDVHLYEGESETRSGLRLHDFDISLGEHVERSTAGVGAASGRLPFLVDVRGAATVFRLPVNVRGGVPGIRVEQRPPDFRPGPRLDQPPSGSIRLGLLHQGGVAHIPRNHLTKHALIAGFTGSGKTVTVQNILLQCSQSPDPTPFLVIESAKREYRGLLGLREFRQGRNALRVFTAGDESCAPIRMNPFELLPGVRVETHISRLRTCFEAALPPIGPLTSMIYEALHDVYGDCGWTLADRGPAYGETLPLRFPQMSDFYARMSALVGERGYEGEVRGNVRAAVLGRLKPLTMGSRGQMLRSDQRDRAGETRRPPLVAEMFEGPTIIELNDLNIEDKALVTMFLLTLLREYREANPGRRNRVAHLTVVEEAHNVLENVQSKGSGENAGADTRYNAVQAFVSLLSEIRALGEGLVIVDQSPEKLAPDALKNTNLIMAHQLRYEPDRVAVGGAMIMEEEQRDFIGKLETGSAALFMTGLQRATFVRVVPETRLLGDEPLAGADIPDDRDAYIPDLSDTVVRRRMAHLCGGFRSGPFGASCLACSSRSECRWRPALLPILGKCDLVERFGQIYRSYIRQELSVLDYWVRFVPIVAELAGRAGGRGDFDAAWCSYLHAWSRCKTWRETYLPGEARAFLERALVRTEGWNEKEAASHGR